MINLQDHSVDISDHNNYMFKLTNGLIFMSNFKNENVDQVYYY
jgi:hypothetical protein